MRKRIVYVEHESEVLKQNPLGDPYRRSLPVYLPPLYESTPESRFPVIWVLAPFAGWGERYFNLSAWDANIIERMDRLIDEGKAAPAILAFPDCFTRYGGSQYRNSSAVGQYEDYLVRELVPFVDANFRTLPSAEHRGVMGHSSGGYGALALTFSHSDVFGAAASHSGDMLFEYCYQPDFPPAIREFERAGGLADFLHELMNLTHVRGKGSDWFKALNTVAMSAAYSPNPYDPNGFDLPFDPYTGAILEAVWARWKALDPIGIAPGCVDALKKMRAVYFDCGINDEYNLFLGARALHQILSERGVPHVFEEHDGGHRYTNWRYEVSLPVLTQALSPQNG
jgi:enterochelin esterase-like enzyme